MNKYMTDEVHKKKVNQASARKYKTDQNFRKGILISKARRYRTDDTFRSNAKAYSKEKYHVSSDAKVLKRETVKKERIAKHTKLENEEEIIRSFKENAIKGIDFTCCCCHRLLFENQVQKCNRQLYEKNEQTSTVANLCINEKCHHECTKTCQTDCTMSTLWICFTCHRKIIRGKIPAEAVANKMALEEIPKELEDLNSLEQHLIALHIPFIRIMALPHGGQRNVHGPVVCVPSDMKKTTSLPIKQGDDSLLRVKLKRKLCYKGYVEYQFVNTNHIFAALNYLKRNNKWYKDIQIDTNWNDYVENDQEPIQDVNEIAAENSVGESHIAVDTCLQPVDIAQEVLDHYFDDIYNIAPGEGKNPVRMLQETGNEAKCFPYHFPSGKFSWNDERTTRITLSRYFNNRLMNADDRFAKDSNYIFFSQYMSELNQVIEKTQILIRKSFTKIGNEKFVTSNIVQDPEVLSKLLKNDEALRFMQPIRGTPAYWSADQKDLFAMLRQLGIPTWFCSFSAAEHRWNDAVSSILRQKNDDRDPEQMDWSEKNEVLRSNPVTVARMFEHRFHAFHRDVICSPSEPIGKVVDFFQRVEFQQRGSPHMHCLFWIENAPKVNENGKEAVCNFIDKYVSCALPSESEDPELRSIVLAVQQHSKNHSKSCRKKGTDYEAVNSRNSKSALKEILLHLWEEVQSELNESRSTEEIFSHLSLTQEQYEEAHNMQTKKTSVVLERNPSELWINQYNPCLLKCWDANMDIQFVLDPFSCIVYIISYISKSEREMGLLLKHTKVEAEEGNLNARDTLKKIGSAYPNHREVSAQEAVYRVCNLKMKECSRKVVFVPVGENPTRLSKPLSILKRRSQKKDHHDNEEEDEDDEDETWMTNIVERYPRFSVEKTPEKYYQSKLQLFLPHWNGKQLKPPGFDLYETFYENGNVKITGRQVLQSVKLLVDTNHARFAENENVRAEAQETFETIGEPEDAWASLCPETELLRQECSDEKTKLHDSQEHELESIPEMQNETNISDVLYQIQQNDISRDEILPVLQSLNETQQEVFYYARDWCLKKIAGEKPEPLHIFITGGAGTGKSHVIKAINYEATRLFARNLSSPDSLAVLLTAFTGTAAFNIGGNTIHHLFSLTKYLPLPYEPLKEQKLSEIRVQLRELQIIVIDEVSMMYKKLLYYIHERLVQIMKSREPFGGVSIIAVGDFYQLPPVKQRKDERLYMENASYPVDYWRDFFKVVELTEVMRQRKDIPFATVLNSLRTREIGEPLGSETQCMIQECIRDGPEEVLHVYPTNDEVNSYNLTMLKRNYEDLVEIEAHDFQKEKTTGKLVLREKPIIRPKTDSLCTSLLMAVKARVMLTRNCNVEDGVGRKSGKKTEKGTVVLIQRVQEEIFEKKSKTIVRHQFPLRLSWACTAHKVQGMTADKVVVNLDRTFSPGQAYVALTRVTSKEGLFIETDNENALQKKVYADPDVKTALRGMPVLELPNRFVIPSTSFNIILLNIQSMQKHFLDLYHDNRFMKAQLICLTETWLKSGQSTTYFEINGFRFHHVPRGDAYDDSRAEMQKMRLSKGGGVALYVSASEKQRIVSPLPEKNIEGIAVKLVQEDIVVVTLYRPSTFSVSKFLDSLKEIIAYYTLLNKHIICLGDFNEDARYVGPIQTFMINVGFQQLVRFYTTEGMTTLDHVYVSKSMKTNVRRMSTYYSYHDALIVTISSDN
ncbi:uncharacterized protein LOC133176667 [Saccostrea echinata]|uniref:uncharacterized protein LOC133176667 n=1 Tax=Saccostrea echinata TaxID=191078 RepID=UPI002A7FFB3A|nr:uncharacterized protein LOC133176667 [Saccostrea echinata]